MKAILMVNDKDSCNLNCSHCFLSYRGKRSPEDASGLIKTFRSQGFEVNLSGSELLTDMDYIRCVRESGHDYVMTNGLILSADKSLYGRLFRMGIDEVRVSRHYGISSDLNSAPLDVSLGVCRDAKLRGFRVGFMVVINDKNYKMVKEMCDDAFRNSADSLMLINYVGSGRLGMAERLELFDSVLEQRGRFSKSDLEILLHGSFGPLSEKGKKLASQNRYCPAVHEQVAITPDNTVYGCPFLMDLPVGRLEGSVIKIERDLFDGRRDCCLVDLVKS